LRQHFVYLSWSEGAFQDAPDVAGRYYPGIFRYCRLVPFQLILATHLFHTHLALLESKPSRLGKQIWNGIGGPSGGFI
jgi:hypothetical protein